MTYEEYYFSFILSFTKNGKSELEPAAILRVTPILFFNRLRRHVSQVNLVVCWLLFQLPLMVYK